MNVEEIEENFSGELQCTYLNSMRLFIDDFVWKMVDTASSGTI